MTKLQRTIARAFLICLLAAGSLLNLGCLAQHILESHERESMAQLNFEREKAGLRPLTWHEYHDHGQVFP
jgi:hypothetical protein